MRTPLVASLALVGITLASPSASAQNVLVFDGGQHGALLAQAQIDYPTTLTVATTADFVSKLTSGSWDMVVANMPSAVPALVWPPLATYISGGGKVALSFWDWDNSSSIGSPVLLSAFEVSNPQTITLTPGVTLFDSGTTTVFQGVTMPNTDWHSHYGDDGDTFTPTGTGIGVAHLGDPAKPTMVLGNQGRTLAMPVIEEAGNTWINSGQLQTLWHNVMDLVLTGGCQPVNSEWISRVGTPPNPDVFHPPTIQGPVIGQPFTPFVDHSVFHPSAILDVVSVCAFPLNVAGPDGTLLVDLSSQAIFQVQNAGQPFDLAVPIDCAFVGITVQMQVGSIAVADLKLTNALQVKIGTQ
ncbi:MAG: hypothetical protein P1V81_06670 [Planctomycetota bacterium]|nr:hypothetical protein [Planctomycetota bacterium]